MISWVNGRNYENLLQFNTICFFLLATLFFIFLSKIAILLKLLKENLKIVQDVKKVNESNHNNVLENKLEE